VLGGDDATPLGSPGASSVAGSPIAADPAACPLPAGSPAATPPDAPSPSGAALETPNAILAEDVQGGADPDEGPGTLRLCVDGHDPIDMSVGCAWSVDRSAVEFVGGSTDRPGGGEASAGIELVGGRFGELSVVLSSLPEPGGLYRSTGQARIGVDAESGAVAGVIVFADVPFEVSGPVANVPPGQPPAIGGTLRWSCGPAPVPIPGLAAGHLTIRLDRPAAQQVETEAICNWTAGVAGASVTAVDMGRPVGIPGDKSWSLHIDQLGDLPLPADPDVTISLSSPNGGDSYAAQSYGAVIVAELGRASQAGRLRFDGLVLGEETGLPTFDGTEATRTLSGIVSWSCEDPLRRPEPPPGGVPPIARPLTRPGVATLTLAGVAAEAFAIPITCRVHDNPADAAGLSIDGADGRFTVGDETVTLIVNDGSLVLFRMGPAGRILGEYRGDDGRGPFLGGVDEVPATQAVTLRFGPVDPAYEPFGGASGPREVGAGVQVDCRDPNNRAP
jgi:hypothetical protein